MEVINHIIHLFRNNNSPWQYVGTVTLGGQLKKSQIKLKYTVYKYIIDSLIKKLVPSKGFMKVFSHKWVYVNGKTFQYKAKLLEEYGFEQGWNPRMKFEVYSKLKR